MTREEMDFIGSMNMCDEISNEAYKKIMTHFEEQEPCDCISRQAVLDCFKKWQPYMATRLLDFEKELSEYFGTKVKIKGKKMEISFVNDNDLDRLLEIMNIKMN